MREVAKGVSIRSYIVGFILSVLLTLGAYFLVSNRLFSHPVLIGVIVALALIQFIVQLVLFLHLGSESKPRWNLLIFLFMLLVVVIVIFGTLWIMYNLNYRVM